MYDYSENENSKKKFILNYKKSGNQLIVKFANGVKRIIPYTKTNEENILKIMEEQVKKYPRLIEENKSKLKDFKTARIIFIILLILSFLLIPLCVYIDKMLLLSVEILICIFSEIQILNVNMDINKMNKIIEDLEKCKIFLEEKENLNANIKMNENILHNVSNKGKKMVNNTPSSEVFTINTINNISLEDLKRIRDNIALERELEKEFHFEYPENSIDKSAYTKK